MWRAITYNVGLFGPAPQDDGLNQVSLWNTHTDRWIEANNQQAWDCWEDFEEDAERSHWDDEAVERARAIWPSDMVHAWDDPEANPRPEGR